MPDTALDAELTEDRVFGARLTVRQPRRGYRVNVDTILLGAAVPRPRTSGMMLEIGCGVGAALMIAALRCPGPRFRTVYIGVEREPAIAALGRANVSANGLADRVSVETGDAFAFMEGRTFAGLFFNPPYDPPAANRAPAPARAHAHVEDTPLDTVVARAANSLEARACFTLIHRAERLTEILAALDRRLGGAEIYPVRPRRGAPAHRVIVRARKGVRAPLRLLEGLDLHDESGAKFTREADAILRGEAEMNWD